MKLKHKDEQFELAGGKKMKKKAKEEFIGESLDVKISDNDDSDNNSSKQD